MKNILFALATAGVLASGTAIAGATTVHPLSQDQSGMFVPVQYYDNHTRWDNDRAASINEREARLKARIQRGMNDGSITRWEARRLYRDLANIEVKERAFRSDGRLNSRESAELNRDLDRLALNVREQRRDEERRY
jgi:hypothetical protein